MNEAVLLSYTTRTAMQVHLQDMQDINDKFESLAQLLERAAALQTTVDQTSRKSIAATPDGNSGTVSA
jgi:hypothetical protein